MSPYFSIVLPIYNVEPYLDRCIQSVLSQSFTDYELILVDDGSTDGCPGICDAYGEKYAFIRVIHKENGGLSSARNAGTEAAKGEYIWWVDSDDWIEPDALQVLYEASKDQNADMVKFNYFRVQSPKSEHKSNARPGVYMMEDVEELRNLAMCSPGKFTLSAWSNIYSRKFLAENKLSFVSERIICSEDYLFNLQALLLAQKIVVITDALYSYILREGSLSKKRHVVNMPQKYTDMYHRIRAFFGEKGKLPEYEGRICRFYAWHLVHGVCIINEYQATELRSVREIRRNVRALLRAKDVQAALRKCDRTGLSLKNRMRIRAMKHGMEPLFYWLCVVKPNKKKGLRHEN
jgi:glycosyltransferase involved in cell wall biosynthesis